MTEEKEHVGQQRSLKVAMKQLLSTKTLFRKLRKHNHDLLIKEH